MDLIIKPTQACNFKCGFCSSSCISKNKTTLSLEKLFCFLDKHTINTIIVNGGDPLMMPPEYYESLLDYISNRRLATTLSFTTNLWDFYINPNKWRSIFKQKNVYVTTSFQYGGERRLGNGESLTEELFCKMIEVFFNNIGYIPMFISVITHKNENNVIETVKLAKKLNTICKINPALKSGRSAYFYPLPNAIEKYLDIIGAGLERYEHNARELKKIVHGSPTICPFNRDCFRAIRCMGPNGELFSCGAIHDNYLINEKNGKETFEIDASQDESKLPKQYPFLKKDCLACELFKLCNGCYKQIMDVKDANFTEQHCRGMQKLKKRLVAL